MRSPLTGPTALLAAGLLAGCCEDDLHPRPMMSADAAVARQLDLPPPEPPLALPPELVVPPPPPAFDWLFAPPLTQFIQQAFTIPPGAAATGSLTTRRPTRSPTQDRRRAPPAASLAVPPGHEVRTQKARLAGERTRPRRRPQPALIAPQDEAPLPPIDR